jgi:hypothetical protein
MCETSLLAVEIEIAVLLKSFFETLPDKKSRRKFLKRLKRNAKRHARGRREFGRDSAAAADVALPRLLAHIGELQSLLA